MDGLRTIAVLGAGGWGTAFAVLLADAGCTVRLLARRDEVVDEINTTRMNTARLPGVRLPAAITATTDRDAALDGVEGVVVAVPAQTVQANVAPGLPEVPVLSLAKGLEESTGRRMSEVLIAAGARPERIGVLSGPNLADEIGARLPASAVIATPDHETAVAWQRACHGPNFRPYTSTDVVGVEVGGVTKNAIAVAVGMAVGLELGANAIAALLTRGLAESTRLGEALGADPLTFSGMAGVGDLVATCYSPLSRNRSFGVELGRGVPPAEAAGHGRGVVESVRSTPVIARLAREKGVEMPIVDTVCDVLSGRLTPEQAVARAMGRSAKPER